MTRLDALRAYVTSSNLDTATMSAQAVQLASSQVSSVDDAFADALSSLFKAQHDLDAVNQQYQAERRRIAAVLATFAASPISASSLQPILDLAAEMNAVAK